MALCCLCPAGALRCREMQDARQLPTYSLQRLLRSPVCLDSSSGAGEQPFPLARHRQPVQDKGHFLFLLRDGALHQRAGEPSGGAKGEEQPQRVMS